MLGVVSAAYLESFYCIGTIANTSSVGFHFGIDKVEFANKFDLNRLKSLENGINHDTIVESYVNNDSRYPNSGVSFRDPNLETPNEIGIEFYFDPLLESACRTSAM